MKKNSVFIILSILVILNALAWIAVFDLKSSQFLEVTFFDVGQGDAIFIETPFSLGRHQILIDGGPNQTILKRLGQEMPFWDRSIDLIILTHPDSDHMRGLIEVLKRYKVEKILWTGRSKNTPEFRQWITATKNEQASIFIAQAGQRVKSSGSDPNLIILWPPKDFVGKIKDDNNTSIVAKLNFGRISFLFTGDIYKWAEKKLVEKYNLNSSSLEFILDSDILKVAHHGSKASTSKKFLEAVLPEVAIISLSRNNPYGHPHPQTLKNLQGVKTLRTDLAGSIKIVSDGFRYKIQRGL